MSQKMQNLSWLLSSIKQYFAKKPKRQCSTTADCIYYRANDSKLADIVMNIQGMLRRGQLPDGTTFSTRSKINKLRARCCGCSDGATASQKNKERALAEQSLNQFTESARNLSLGSIEGEQSGTSSNISTQRVTRKNPML